MVVKHFSEDGEIPILANIKRGQECVPRDGENRHLRVGGAGGVGHAIAADDAGILVAITTAHLLSQWQQCFVRKLAREYS